MQNRLYRADCKAIIDKLIREGVRVDLIYLDPPFNSNRTYSLLFQQDGITAQQKAYHDMWDFTDHTRQLVLEFHDELKNWDFDEPFKAFIRAWIAILEQGTSEDKKLLNYLMYMTARLVRMQHLLKPSGSIFFHCDPTASHYLKVILDGVFGRGNFRNEIIWKRTSSHNNAKRFGPVHDVILFYTKGKQFTWNRILQPHDEQYVETYYKYEDEQGRLHRRSDMTASETREGESGSPWKGYDPTIAGRHWAVPAGRSFPPWFKRPAGFESMTVQERLDILDEQHLIYWPPTGKVPQYKRYLETLDGMPIQDVVTDIYNEGGSSKYQTKKPNALLRRIILAATNEGDTVLDPFCGCGTTIEVAHEEKRNWIGIDISGLAVDEIEIRLGKHGQYRDKQFAFEEGNPETMAEYNRLTALEKQDWLIRRLQGLPNPKKSGDAGIDGELDIHLGTGEDGRDRWGRIVFSVKTGKQRKPEHVRELIGTMKSAKAEIGVLILDMDPTAKMEEAAKKGGTMEYHQRRDMPPKEYDRVQILTAFEIIEGAKIDCPPTMQAVRRFREAQKEVQGGLEV